MCINHFMLSYSRSWFTRKQQQKILQHLQRHQDCLQSVSVQSSLDVVQTCDYWVGSEQRDFHYSLFTETHVCCGNYNMQQRNIS